jgi:exopolysaccharide biosynthesis operon protein EpsL
MTSNSLRIAPLLIPALVGMALTTMAYADAEDVLNVVVGASLTHDDNLFRLSDNPGPSASIPSTQSDWITSTSLGLRIDKPWSLQRFQLSATASNYRYRNFSFLNFSGVDYRAAWLWQVTPRLTGRLTADREQSLNNYADYRGSYTARNTRVNENRRFDADWWLQGSWHLLGGGAEYQQRNGQLYNADGDYRLRSVEAGGKYVAESGSNISLLGRSGRGDYLNRSEISPYDNRFDQNEAEIRAIWLASGKSTLDGRLTHVERKYEHLNNLDYSGTTGRLDYSWAPTAKLHVDLVAAREISSYQEYIVTSYNSSYYVADSLSVAPVWLVSDKTSLRLKYEQGQRDFRGELSPGAVVPAQRSDKPRTLLLGLDWTPTRTLSLNGTLKWDRRSSNITGLDYSEASAAFSAQLAF